MIPTLKERLARVCSKASLVRELREAQALEQAAKTQFRSSLPMDARPLPMSMQKQFNPLAYRKYVKAKAVVSDIQRCYYKVLADLNNNQER